MFGIFKNDNSIIKVSKYLRYLERIVLALVGIFVLIKINAQTLKYAVFFV